MKASPRLQRSSATDRYGGVSRDTTDSPPLTRSQANLIALADLCSRVRADIGHLFMTPENSEERRKARKQLHRNLRTLLETAREEDVGTFLEVAAHLD